MWQYRLLHLPISLQLNILSKPSRGPILCYACLQLLWLDQDGLKYREEAGAGFGSFVSALFLLFAVTAFCSVCQKRCTLALVAVLHIKQQVVQRKDCGFFWLAYVQHAQQYS